MSSFAPRLYALDEGGHHIRPWLGCERDGSDFCSWPGVPAVLEVTESTQISDRAVLMDVDTLAVRRVDRFELDGKWQCNFSAPELRAHLETKVAECRRYRLRYDQKIMERALRRLAASGAPSSWKLSCMRPHPEHPLEDRDFLRRDRQRWRSGTARKAPSTAGSDGSAAADTRRGSARRPRDPMRPLLEQALDVWPELRERLS